MPIGVPVRKPRKVSMNGVNGWYSANQRTAVGIEPVGTNPLPRNGSSSRGIGRLLAVSTLFVDHAERDRQPGERECDHREDADGREPLDGAGGGPEADQQRDADDDGDAQHRLDYAADDVSGQDRGARDRHRAESGDDPFGHVHGDRNRRPCGPAGNGHQQDAWNDVVRCTRARPPDAHQARAPSVPPKT